jgi:hypothetical protein
MGERRQGSSRRSVLDPARHFAMGQFLCGVGFDAVVSLSSKKK